MAKVTGSGKVATYQVETVSDSEIILKAQASTPPFMRSEMRFNVASTNTLTLQYDTPIASIELYEL